MLNKNKSIVFIGLRDCIEKTTKLVSTKYVENAGLKKERFSGVLIV